MTIHGYDVTLDVPGLLASHEGGEERFLQNPGREHVRTLAHVRDSMQRRFDRQVGSQALEVGAP
jgi:hypothetical protein